MTASTPKHTFPLSRLALIAAAIIALTAIGIAIFKRNQPEGPAITQTQEKVPDIPAMIAKLEAKLKQDPQNPKGWRMLGWSYFETGRYADAASAYRHAAELAPDKAQYWSALGEALVLASNGNRISAEASDAFAKAIAADPKDPRARYFIGAAKEQAGDHKAAIDGWMALLHDSPPNAPWSQSVRERIASVAGANNIAVSLPTPVADAIPGPTSEQLQAAAGMTPAEQNAMAREMVDRLAAKLRANPNNPDGWVRLMRARTVLGDNKGAAQALADARAAFANDPRQQAAFKDAARTLGIAD